ncbi:hypothetical protein ACFL37_01595 [Candidatus Margulisiibacteriota bacterium]
MKRTLILLLVIGLLHTVSTAAEVDVKEEVRTKIAKIEAEIARLGGRLGQIEDDAKVNQLLSIIEDHEAHLEKLKKNLVELEKPKIEAATPEAVPETVPEVIAQPEAVPQRDEEVSPSRRFNFEIGGMAGLFAATTGALGELRLPLPYIFGPATSSLRLAGGLCQSEDMSTRYASIHVDCILNFPAGWFTGVENYLGGGLNHVVRMTGPDTGTIGAQVFYGIESRGFGGKLFGEMGYGTLRSSTVSAHKGISVMVGYRRDWGF